MAVTHAAAAPYVALDEGAERSSCGDWRYLPAVMSTIGLVLAVVPPILYGICKARDSDNPNDQTSAETYDGFIKTTVVGSLMTASSVGTALVITACKAAYRGYSTIGDGGRAVCSSIGSVFYDSIRLGNLGRPEGYLINTIVGPFKCMASLCKVSSRVSL